MNLTRNAVLALALAVAAVPAAAQSIHAPPPRPALWAGADTADANTYYNLGVQRLEAEPREAADAFYWAYRLRPGWADALYARRVALLMSNPERLTRYVEGSRTTARSAEVLAIDSLYLRALTQDPFLFRKFDRAMLMAYLQRAAENSFRRNGEMPNNAMIRDWIAQSAASVDPETAAWRAYSEGRFPDAIRFYERATRSSRNRSRNRAELARVLYLAGENARAVEEMAKAIDEMRREDEKDLVYVYESKALLEHSVAAIHEKEQRADSARQAYARALHEDLAFHPAHVRLARLALAAGDTASAVSEMDLAAQIADTDGALRNEYADLLIAARRYPDAVEQLKKAIELEPYFAAPHLTLGRIHDASGMRLEAVQNYRDFLARAARGDAQRAWAEARLATLEAGLKAEGQ